MKAYQFTIPQDKVTLEFEAGLAKGCGGFTRSIAVGAWINPEGKVEVEHVYLYQVALATETDHLGSFWLFKYVMDFATLAGERAVHYGPVGNPHIYPTGN